MVQVTVTEDILMLEVLGMDKLWALKTRLDIPLRHISSVEVSEKIAKSPQGWRELGTYFPGVLTAGIVHHDGKRIFWDVHNPDNAIVINLHDDRYNQLIVEVSDPLTAIEQIRAALS